MVTDLVYAGENGRYYGYDFEDVILELINNYNTNEQGFKIVSFIANDLGILDFATYEIYGEKAPKNVKNRFGGQKKPPKSDIHIVFKKGDELIKKGISIKSSNGSIQVQITNVKNFKEILIKNGIVFSSSLEVGLSKFCGFGDYKPSKLLIGDFSKLSTKELNCLINLELNTKISEKDTESIDCINNLFNLEQGRRNRWLINELTNDERLEIKNFFTINQKKITEIVLKEGYSEEFYFADYYLYNNNEYSNTKLVDISIQNMDKVIEKSCIKPYKETSQGSFHIGDITVQMKGSGKGEAFHGLQFNKRT